MAQDLVQQQRKIQELREQLDRVNSIFEEQKKALNVTDAELKEAAKEPVPRELEEQMAQASREAAAAGRQAAAELSSEKTSSTRAAPRRRGLAI